MSHRFCEWQNRLVICKVFTYFRIILHLMSQKVILKYMLIIYSLTQLKIPPHLPEVRSSSNSNNRIWLHSTHIYVKTSFRRNHVACTEGTSSIGADHSVQQLLTPPPENTLPLLGWPSHFPGNFITPPFCTIFGIIFAGLLKMKNHSDHFHNYLVW